MGTTTFTGPIKAGNVLATSGTTVGKLANVGSVVMAQSANVQSQVAARATGVVIPANSQITNITMLTTVAFTGATTLGVVAGGTGLTVAKATIAIDVREVFSPLDGDLWVDVGSSDVEIYIKGANAIGTGVLTVEYIQNNNLTA